MISDDILKAYELIKEMGMNLKLLNKFQINLLSPVVIGFDTEYYLMRGDLSCPLGRIFREKEESYPKPFK